MQNQQNRLKETVLEEQTICGITESFVKLTEQQLKKHNYANSNNEVTNLEIDQRLRNRFAIETKTKGTTNGGICSGDVLYDKEIPINMLTFNISTITISKISYFIIAALCFFILIFFMSFLLREDPK